MLVSGQGTIGCDGAAEQLLHSRVPQFHKGNTVGRTHRLRMPTSYVSLGSPVAEGFGDRQGEFDNQGSPQWVSGHSKSAASAKPWSLRAIAPHTTMKYGLLGSIAVRIRAISVLQMPPVGLSCMRALTRGSALNVLLRTFGRVNMPVSTRGC